jgi:hypothetical protein
VKIRRNTAITEPLNSPAFSRQEREAGRHVARAIIHVATGKPAPARPLRDTEVRAVLHSNVGKGILRSAEVITREHPHSQHRSIFQKAVHFAFGGPQFTQQATAPGMGQAQIVKTAAVAGVNTGRAFVEDPVGVGTKTAAGAGQLAVGAIAAVPELAIRTVTGAAHGDPFAGVKEIAHQAAKDFSRRYGGIYRGEPGAAKAFRERIKKEGAASELIDAASIAAPEGALAGRAAGSLARAGKLGARAQGIATEARPALRVSGEASRPQEVSRNLIRAGAQRAEDTIRAQRLERRNARAAERGQPKPGLQPRAGEVVPATLASQRRVQRVEASKIAARVYEGFKNEQQREVHAGAKRAIAKLTPKQRQAVHTVVQGIVTAHDPVAAVRQLRARNEQIRAARAADTAERAKHGLGPRPISDRLEGDELKLNEHLIRHAPEIFNFKLAEFQKAEAARSIRVAAESADAHPAFKSSTAQVRRLRPQAEALGIPYPYELATREIEAHYESARRAAKSDEAVAAARTERDHALAALEERKPQIDAAFAGAVRSKARAAGLPEPGFISHAPRPEYGFSDYAPGGGQAITGVRRTQLVLHRLGLADTQPTRYVQSLARSVKYKHNWPGVAAQAEAHEFKVHEFGDGQELRDILGRHGEVNPDALSIEDWRRILHAKGLDPKAYAFWNPRRLRVAKEAFQRTGHESEHLDLGIGPEGAPGVHEGWQASAVDEKRLAELPADQREIYVQSQGWKLLPREAYDEITSGTQPSGWAGRGVGKVQNLQSRVLLGLNPTWLQVQVAANVFQAGFGTAFKGGNPAHLIEARRWYARQPEDVRATIDEALSTGVFAAHGERVHLGAAADNAIVNWVRALKDTAAFQRAGRYNPMDLIFRGDNAQNAFFRRTLLYSSVKRAAFKDLGRKVGADFKTQEEIAKVLAIKDPEARMTAIVRNHRLFEEHASFVNDILGDFSRYTARERRTLKRGILFYGFLRFSLRTLFYTLPVKHPLAAAVAGKLAQLHNDEVRDLLGGPDAPWAYSRVFFEKDGKLRSIDFGRANPVTNQFVNVTTEGPASLGGLLSPAVQGITDQLYGRSLYSGRGFKVEGSAEENPNPSVGTRARIAAGDLLSTAFPYREAVKLTQGEQQQGDDSLLFSPRPTVYKTPQAQGSADERAAQRGSGTQQVLRDLAPLVIPKPDTSRDTVAARRRKRAASAGGGSNPYGFNLPSGAGSSGTASSGSSNPYGFNLP